jgi:hypothetical protein
MSMENAIRRFELAVLRPLQIAFVVAAIVSVFQGMWWCLGGCVVGVLALGVIGAGLHPLQSASDLSQGPTESPAARVESRLLPPEVQSALVGRACTGVGILLGLTATAVFWGLIGWSWYIAIPLAWVAAIFSGALLKLVFKAV